MSQTGRKAIFDAVTCTGHKKAFDSFTEKLRKLAKALEHAETIFERDVLPVELEDTGNSKDAFLWRMGVHAGMMMLFYNSLTGKEQDIDALIQEEMAKASEDGKPDPYDVVAYMEASKAVYDRFGLISWPSEKGVAP